MSTVVIRNGKVTVLPAQQVVSPLEARRQISVGESEVPVPLLIGGLRGTRGPTGLTTNGWIGPFTIGMTLGALPDRPLAIPGVTPAGTILNHVWMPNTFTVIVDYPENITAAGNHSHEEVFQAACSMLPESGGSGDALRLGEVVLQVGIYLVWSGWNHGGKVNIVGAGEQEWFSGTRIQLDTGGPLYAGNDPDTYLITTLDANGGNANGNFWQRSRNLTLLPLHRVSGWYWGGAQGSCLDNVHVKRWHQNGYGIKIRSSSNGFSVIDSQCWGGTPSDPAYIDGPRIAYFMEQYTRGLFLNCKPESCGSSGVGFYADGGDANFHIVGAYTEGVGLPFKHSGYGGMMIIENSTVSGVSNSLGPTPDEGNLLAPFVVPALGVPIVVTIDNATGWINDNDWIEFDGYGFAEVTNVAGNSITIETHLNQIPSPDVNSLAEGITIPINTVTRQRHNSVLIDLSGGLCNNVRFQGDIRTINETPPFRDYYIRTGASGGGGIYRHVKIGGPGGGQKRPSFSQTAIKVDMNEPPPTEWQADSVGVRKIFPAENPPSSFIHITSSRSSDDGEVVLNAGRTNGVAAPDGIGEQANRLELGAKVFVYNDTENRVQVYPHSYLNGQNADTIASVGVAGSPLEIGPRDLWMFTWLGDKDSDLNGWWQDNKIGGNREKFRAIVAVETLTDADVGSLLLCNGTFTVSLPVASTVVGADFSVKNVGVGTITVDVDGGGTIDLAATQVMSTQYEVITFRSYDTGYAILSRG